MEIALTKPIEEFIQRKIEKGYANPNEVARQAFLRWMEEEESESPPGLCDKLEQARQGEFSPHSPGRYDSLVSGAA